MALSSTYNNNKDNKNDLSLSMYSNYRMNHAESAIDPTCISFRYWKSNLCIGIYPRKNTGNDEVSFDMDNGIVIYLSHTKARILKNEVEKFLMDPITYNGVGVPSGQAIISISNGVEYGKDAPCVTIRKVNDSGEVVASFAYEFRRNYHYSVRNYTGGNDFTKEFNEYNNIEIEQLVTVLDEYVKASTNAIAFTVMHQRQFSFNRLDSKIEAIASNLGVELPKSGQQRRSYNNSSFFNSSNGNSGNSYGGNSGGYSSGVSYSSATMDDLE